MTVKEFIEIAKTPYTISNQQANALNEIVQEFPYFQAARVLQLKILHSQGDYRYTKALKLAAVHVTDRSVLFDFINSKSIIPNFSALRNDFERIKKAHEHDHNENTPPKVSYIDPDPIFPDELINHQELVDLFVPKDSIVPRVEETPQWVQQFPVEPDASVPYKDDNVAEKFKLIDKFLENNPKIAASKDYVSEVNLADEVKVDERRLMTETLAQVYVNQRKYKQAIQAYEILILKYPKKSAYFAAQIEQIKKLQQNN